MGRKGHMYGVCECSWDASVRATMAWWLVHYWGYSHTH
jgi:hypothetical protein